MLLPPAELPLVEPPAPPKPLPPVCESGAASFEEQLVLEAAPSSAPAVTSAMRIQLVK
jgi:hypothetical protein